MSAHPGGPHGHVPTVRSAWASARGVRWAARGGDQGELPRGFESDLTVPTAASEQHLLQTLSPCVHLPQLGVTLLRPAGAVTPSPPPAREKRGSTRRSGCFRENLKNMVFLLASPWQKVLFHGEKALLRGRFPAGFLLRARLGLMLLQHLVPGALLPKATPGYTGDKEAE